jgi:AcrR family transcriptional regulator
MTTRAEAAAATRERILETALEQFLAHWYDEVTVAGIARAAGVSQQTIVNHFGSKDGLLEAAVDRLDPASDRDRFADPVEGIVADYESTGDPILRFLALEDRMPVLRPLLETGRAAHRAWTERAFADRLPADGAQRERALDLHVVATDVFTWKLLRRDMGKSRADTVDAMRALVDALTTPPHP